MVPFVCIGVAEGLICAWGCCIGPKCAAHESSRAFILHGRLVPEQVIYLTDALALSPARLKRMIVAMPTLLSYSVEDNLKPKVMRVSGVRCAP